MPQLREEPIVEVDLTEYLQSDSDFSFELQVLRLLRTSGWNCEHGGLYQDPATKKSREFDIRAIARQDRYVVRLAVECKNVREYFPLLVSCIPRHASEEFHEIAEIKDRFDHAMPGAMIPRARVIRVKEPRGDAARRQLVGKSLAQVGRTKAGRELFAADEGIFDKWAQCLASADDLVARSACEKTESGEAVFAMVLPIVVVPDGRLWSAEYDFDGKLLSGPTQRNHCSFFVDRGYKMDPMLGPWISITYLEIVTMTGLRELAGGSATDMTRMASMFSNGF